LTLSRTITTTPHTLREENKVIVSSIFYRYISGTCGSLYYFTSRTQLQMEFLISGALRYNNMLLVFIQLTPLFSLYDMNCRRKIKTIQIASNGLRNSTMHSNCVRADLLCPKLTSLGLNKHNNTGYKQNFPLKNPVRVTFMKFSNASASMLEEMTVEEEVNSSHSSETQVIKVDVAPCNPELSTTVTERKLAGGDNRGWTLAKNKLAEGKKEMNGTNKYERKSNGSHVSNRFASIGRRQVSSTDVVSNLVRQGHGEHVSSSVQYSVLNNSKMFTDSETFVHQFNESALEISEEKITKINGDDVLEETAMDSTDVTFDRKARRTDQSKLRDRLCRIYEDILVVDNIPLAEEVVKMITVKYRHLIYACDTEV